MAGVADEKRSTHAAFGGGTLEVAERRHRGGGPTWSVLGIGSFFAKVVVTEVEILGVVGGKYVEQLGCLAAVVAHEDDNGVVEHALCIQMVEQTADAVVH